MTTVLVDSSVPLAAFDNNITVYDATYVVAARDAGHKLLSCDI